MIVRNDRGLSFSFGAAGSLNAIAAGPIAVCPNAGSWLSRSMANLYLRRRGRALAATPLLGPVSPSRYRALPGVFEARGSWAELDYTCTLTLSPSDHAWRFAVHVHNGSDEPAELDLMYVQHVSLKTASAGLSNEAYVAQYLERRVLDDPRHGRVVLCRQNMREATGHPWLMLASAGRALAASTDGLQFYGTRFRATGEPEALGAAALGGELSGEAAVVALQEAPFVVEPGATHRCSFVASFVADHPEASSEADLTRLPDLVSSLPDLPETPVPAFEAPAGHRFQTPRPFPAEDLDAAAIDREFGRALRHVERDGDTLLSFFCDGPRHVVLRQKELRVLRPHGHILQAFAQGVPDERVMSTTAFACGVFNAHLTQGNTHFNTLLSVCTTPATPNLEGQRIFVELDDGEYLLGVPSAFEMGLGHCRWLYEHQRVSIEVCTWTDPSAPYVHLALRVLRGGPLRFSITHQFDGLGWDLAPLSHGELVATPRAGSMLAGSFPGARFRLVIHGDRAGLCAIPLVAPSLAYGSTEGATLVLEVPATRALCMSFVGEVTGPAPTPHIADPFSQRTRDGERMRASALTLGGAAAAAPLAETLPWYELNALVHYLTPYGLEQFSGAAWGTRDVCQGPIELLLCQGRHAEAKEVLRILFSRQDPDGGWPQWWMFDRYSAVRADGAHGDVIYWCILALCSYLRVSSDFTFLDEPLPFFARADAASTSAPLSEHVERVLAMVERSFVPGTALVQFGGGDWNDSLQPVSEDLARRMISSWTVQMSYQAVDEYRALCERAGHNARAEALAALAARIHADFQQHLVRDGVVAGYGLVGDDGRISLLLHPSDTQTGVHYSLLPMDRGVISGVFTKAQAEAHLTVISEHLTGPDGARLMDRPLPYTGGRERIFRRAESSCYFGREIGLMYVHEHLRYAETLARMGKPEAFLRALRQAIPVGYREVVPEGTLRQANCYYSSSDVLFPSRYDADLRYADVLAGKLPLEGGWRVYSSGPGIFIAHVVTRLLGVRTSYDQLIFDPVLAPSLDGLCATVQLCGRAITFRFRVVGAGFGPSAVTVNGQALPFEREPQPYRTGGAVFPRAGFEALLGAGENVVEVVV
jgi:1,2-beta-oligoglucan phosphorylase